MNHLSKMMMRAARKDAAGHSRTEDQFDSIGGNERETDGSNVTLERLKCGGKRCLIGSSVAQVDDGIKCPLIPVH